MAIQDLTIPTPGGLTGIWISSSSESESSSATHWSSILSMSASVSVGRRGLIVVPSPAGSVRGILGRWNSTCSLPLALPFTLAPRGIPRDVFEGPSMSISLSVLDECSNPTRFVGCEFEGLLEGRVLRGCPLGSAVRWFGATPPVLLDKMG